MTKKNVNVVKKHEVLVDMNAVDKTLVSNIEMLDGHLADALDPREEDQNPVSFADNPYYNRDVFLTYGATCANFEKSAEGQRDWQKKLETQRDDEVRPLQEVL